MLADRGVLEQAGSSYRVVADLGQTLDVPETLHALVAARLDGLPDAERSLVLDAAVTGHSFTLDAVCAVSGRSRAGRRGHGCAPWSARRCSTRRSTRGRPSAASTASSSR